MTIASLSDDASAQSNTTMADGKAAVKTRNGKLSRILVSCPARHSWVRRLWYRPGHVKARGYRNSSSDQSRRAGCGGHRRRQYFRGAGLARAGMDRVTGDHMGMLATVINSLALQDALEAVGGFARVMSAVRINEVCEEYIRRRAVRHLEKGRVTIFAAGTGNPFFTTDTAASLRAIEIDADVLLKATKVNGIYTADPVKDPNAQRYQRLTFGESIDRSTQCDGCHRHRDVSRKRFAAACIRPDRAGRIAAYRTR